MALCIGEVISRCATLILDLKLQARSVYLPERPPLEAIVQLLVVALKELLASPSISLLKDLVPLSLLPIAGANLSKWPAFR